MVFSNAQCHVWGEKFAFPINSPNELQCYWIVLVISGCVIYFIKQIAQPKVSVSEHPIKCMVEIV